MTVRLRMKKMGRKHRAFFRLVAVDKRAPRDGKVIEYLGQYDPMIQETDARASLNAERIDYWLSVGAQPSDRVGVLIKKYGTDGTHLEQQREALARLEASKPTAPPAVAIPKPKAEEPPAEEATAEASSEATEAPAAEEASAETSSEAKETPAAETAKDEAPAAEATETAEKKSE